LFDELSRQTGGLHLSLDQGVQAGIALANFYLLLLDREAASQGGSYSNLEVELVLLRGIPTERLSLSHRAGFLTSSANTGNQ